ncbi:MAG TPA: carbonic anhydrase [Bacteroidia bacterium]|jgi:carbonic anhydrase|nr:carbonic anhydrase [Bacteroidia bacterium]
MDSSYKKLIDGNRKFSLQAKLNDADYFKKLSLGQTPEYLWIGCSDSRVPANEITGTQAGEMFVHRNIANVVVHTDFNLLSVVEYAVEVLKVKHIIVCGHYGCGGVRASMSNNTHGFVDNWLRNIKEVYNKYYQELDAIADDDARADRLTELNVTEQVKNLAKTKTVQKAWKERKLEVHGWVYGLNSGLIKDLNVLHDDLGDIEPIFRYRDLI